MKKTSLLGALVLIASTAWTQGKPLYAKSYLGQKAPDFVVEKWLTPEPAMKGKYVLIDFWATWCPSCREAIPKLNQIQKKLGDRLVVIGISDETEEVVRKMTAPSIDYAEAIDTQARMKNEFEVIGIPNVFLIDPHGIVRWQGYPLEAGYELTPVVVEKLMQRYGK